MVFAEEGTVCDIFEENYRVTSGSQFVTGSSDPVEFSNPLVFTGSSTTNNITIDVGDGVDISIKLKNLQILSPTNASAIYINSGNVTLILEGNNVLSGGQYYAGIEVGEDASLTITSVDGDGSNTGTLLVNGGQGAAGIGGGSNGRTVGSYTETNNDRSNITINGGTVTANGGRSETVIMDGDEIDDESNGGAGIGGGTNGGAGIIITINGGTVTANGGTNGGINGGAGIGGGYGGVGSNITIKGGTVTANGANYAAGIGGGQGGSGRNITIEGGTVTAHGGEEAAGIGGGSKYNNISNLSGDGSVITISGGIVNATGGSNGGAGIGGGNFGSGSGITISGGIVNATGGSGDGGEIGGGAGIGAGNSSPGTDITISGGTVNATGGNMGAGIGGSKSNGERISISGGSVNATGGDSAAGIGGGGGGAGNTITITGGSIIAYAGERGSAIGNGNGTVANRGNQITTASGVRTVLCVDGGTPETVTEVIGIPVATNRIEVRYEAIIPEPETPPVTPNPAPVGNSTPQTPNLIESESRLGLVACELQQTSQGEQFNRIVQNAMPENYESALSFNMMVNNIADTSAKSGELVVTIPESFRKAVRSFALIGVDSEGKPSIFADTDQVSNTITVKLNSAKMYAFSLIYSDNGGALSTGHVYIVKKGDTLSAIARKLGVKMSDLVEANQLEDPNRIRIEQELNY